MSPSPRTAAIDSPLPLVASLYAQGKSPLEIASHFSNLLGDSLHDIPELSFASSKQHSLVRWNCMIQDTGLGNEVFQSDYAAKCCLFNEGPITAEASPAANEDSPDLDYNKLQERTLFYATQIPGKAKWVDNGSIATELGSLSISSSPSFLPGKYPSTAEHLGVMLKVYDESLEFRPTDLVQVVGVLDTIQYSNSLTDSESTTPLQTIHVLTVKPFRLPSLVPAIEPSEDIRTRLIELLASQLSHDKLAAEYLLLSLVGRVHSRMHGSPIGQLPLNLITSLPLSLSETLASILPLYANIQLTMENLNTKTKFSPESRDEDLKSGALQLPQGSTVLVDEISMTEGQLNDQGVRNVRALSSVIVNQKLSYVFPYSEFEFETDIDVIVVSKNTKTFLPVDCQIVVEPAEGESVIPSQADLDSFRSYIASCKTGDFSVPEATSKHIQDMFVTKRQNKEWDADRLTMLMSIARLWCLSMGLKELDVEGWQKVVDMEERRLARKTQK